MESADSPTVAGRATGRIISKVLVANRGEIAVRVIRAARDAGIGSVAVYSDGDRDSVAAKLADSAYALGGTDAAATYLDMDKILEVARRSDADAIHPGYGFLSENAEFAARVIDAGLVWIGPPPEAIEQLGDKVRARQIAERVGAPLVPGTKDPVSGPDEAVAFAEENGLPIAIKAAYGGGGRGLKVAREHSHIRDLYASAVREATAAFGRGECFIERFLDGPRHVETQCLADADGHVVVVSTRDCSLQRRNQKLVEEAPAPFLTAEQRDALYRGSKAILAEAGYVGAGTCEFLIGRDGEISFLEVNTRLQVEHPVSEQVTGLDLVREQFRLASGQSLGYDDPADSGHAIEFRINGEDAGRGFLPSPGPVKTFDPPAGPGVRLDSGVRAGDVVTGDFDSMLAKLVITGADRAQALERSRRALAEFTVEGLPTVIPFHRAVVDDPAFIGNETGFGVHTRWIETEFSGDIPRFEAAAVPPQQEPDRDSVVVEVEGRRLEVSLPGGLSANPAKRAAHRRTRRHTSATVTPSSNAVVAPMQGTIVKIAVDVGTEVAEGDLVAVLEAMKMEQPLLAHKDGVVAGIKVDVGQAVSTGAEVVEID